MGQYADETVLKARRQMEERERERHSDKVIDEELKQSIYDQTVRIFHIPVSFKEMDILEGRASMRLPEDFTLRSEEEIKRVYFLGNKPQYVYTNQYLDFALALNWTEHEVSDEGVFEFARYIKYMIDRVGPKSRIVSEEPIKKKEGNMVLLRLLSNALDGVNHTTIFFASVENRLLLGSIAFDQKLSKRLVPLTDEIVKSFRLKREEDNDGNDNI